MPKTATAPTRATRAAAAKTNAAGMTSMNAPPIAAPAMPAIDAPMRTLADERRRDDERDVGGAPAHPPHDDGHERDDDRDVHAGAEGASRVDSEVAAHACGCPVAFHTRD